MDLEKLAERDISEAASAEEQEAMEATVLALRLGTEVEYANWGPTGDILVAVRGCYEQGCRAGVARIHKNNDGSFVSKGDVRLPFDAADINIQSVFVASVVGADEPEIWVVYSSIRNLGTGAPGPDGVSFDEVKVEERHAAIFSLPGLSLLGSTFLSKGGPCFMTFPAGDLDRADDLRVNEAFPGKTAPRTQRSFSSQTSALLKRSATDSITSEVTWP